MIRYHPLLDDLLEYLREPLVELSGTAVTPLSILTAITIILVARIVAGVLGRSAGRIFRGRGADRGVEFAVAKIVRYIVTIIGVFVALSSIGVNMNAVFAAGAVLLVGIGFGLQKMAENFISGLILLVERPVRKGDFIQVGDILGTVEDIGLRATHVVSRDGITVIVPNADLVSGMVVNHSVPTTTLRVWVKVGVAYGSNLELVMRLLLECAAREKLVQAQPAPEVRHEGFGESSVDLALVVWIADARDDLMVLSNLRFAIEKAFNAHGVEIPFPQRVVHMASH